MINLVKLGFSVIVLSFVYVSGVWAGCENYEKGGNSGIAPRGIICFEADCELTSLLYRCANAYSATAGYLISLSNDPDMENVGVSSYFEFTPNEPEEHQILWSGYPISKTDQQSMVCIEIGDHFCSLAGVIEIKLNFEKFNRFGALTLEEFLQNPKAVRYFLSIERNISRKFREEFGGMFLLQDLCINQYNKSEAQYTLKLIQSNYETLSKVIKPEYIDDDHKFMLWWSERLTDDCYNHITNLK